MSRLLIALYLSCLSLAAPARAPVLVVDLSEAYTRSTALAGLLADIDAELKQLAQRHRPALERLRGELQRLKQQHPADRDQQLAIARQISDIEATAELEQENLAQANQTAIAEVDSAIAKVKAVLQAETEARAVLDIQETQYVRPDCPCLATERLYELLNERLPKVELRLADS